MFIEVGVREKYVEFMQKGRRIVELEGNIFGTGFVVKDRILMSFRFWVFCSDLKYGFGYCLVVDINKSIKFFNKNQSIFIIFY